MTPWTAAHQAFLSFTVTQSVLKFMTIQSVILSNYLILCCLLSLLLLSVFPSIRVFSNESVLHIRWPKYWSFSFGISPCSEYSGLISFRMDWFDFLEEEKKNLWGACKDNLLIRKEQFAKMFFSITTLWFTLLATAMFG